MAAPYQELDDYMIDYHPYHGGENRGHSPGSDSQTLVFIKSGLLQQKDPQRYRAFRIRIYKWLVEYVKNLGDSSSIVVSIAPGHEKNSQPIFLRDIVNDVLKQFKCVKDGSHCLRRTNTVQKSTEGGIRTESTHRNSIKVDDSELVKDKTVIIIDDVWTSGSTLRACASLVEDAGASDTKMIAVGKTVSD